MKRSQENGSSSVGCSERAWPSIAYTTHVGSDDTPACSVSSSCASTSTCPTQTIRSPDNKNAATARDDRQGRHAGQQGMRARWAQNAASVPRRTSTKIGACMPVATAAAVAAADALANAGLASVHARHHRAPKRTTSGAPILAAAVRAASSCCLCMRTCRQHGYVGAFRGESRCNMPTQHADATCRCNIPMQHPDATHRQGTPDGPALSPRRHQVLPRPQSVAHCRRRRRRRHEAARARYRAP